MNGTRPGTRQAGRHQMKSVIHRYRMTNNQMKSVIHRYRMTNNQSVMYL
jgi:hypothetical protein